MKKKPFLIIIATLFLLFVLELATADKEVIGTWEKYGILTEDGVISCEELGDNTKYCITFEKDNTVKAGPEGSELEGTCRKEDGRYIVSIPFTSKGDVAELECILNKKGDLIVKQLIPEGYEADESNPIICKKVG